MHCIATEKLYISYEFDLIVGDVFVFRFVNVVELSVHVNLKQEILFHQTS